jgi:acyl-CoA synthetase (AMP-forming)/AMP-acid ligase II
MTTVDDFETLVEMLRFRGENAASTEAFVFDSKVYSFSDVWEGAQRVATLLHKAGVSQGHTVVLVAPNGPEFFWGFYGALLLGAAPAPVFPGSGAERVQTFARLCEASAICCATELDHLYSAASQLPQSERRPTFVVIGDARHEETALELATLRADDLAFLQYTSGSTGNPKGVQLTHRCLLTNSFQMIEGMEITTSDIFVSWLPAHHDMGLILKTIVPFLLPAPLILLPTTLTRVSSWFEAINDYRGTFTAAPDFAWRLATRFIRDADRFDLSTLRVGLNAAEPVRASTIDRFEERFNLSRVVVPGYGLAEATVGVSMQKPGTPYIVDNRGFVSIGQYFPQVEAQIVDDAGEPTDDVGELVISSPANTAGYFRNTDATQQLFWKPGWIRTGDLAYRNDDGDVFVISRKKNIIIQGGRNLAPQELEETVEGLKFVRRSAAVGVDRGGSEGEQAYIFVELRQSAPPDESTLDEMAVQVVESLFESIGLRPGRVLFLRPRSIPMTPNGKIRYPELRSAYLSKSMHTDGSLVYPRY